MQAQENRYDRKLTSSLSSTNSPWVGIDPVKNGVKESNRELVFIWYITVSGFLEAGKLRSVVSLDGVDNSNRESHFEYWYSEICREVLTMWVDDSSDTMWMLLYFQHLPT
jgi:hypothetical protein